jgi:diaminohydroxyphosphoribosylaminopyrimidine deaminase/5-amino-6-(5-phosphoribosylamino)uracil reductase
MTTDSHAQRRLMDLAARAAWRAHGHVEPNPLVGAVLVRDGVVIGIGHHRRFGDLHAEREAIRNARSRGHDPRGADFYVTLEPCSHHGKQPPCTDAIIEAGVARVFYAVDDPGAESGGGAVMLRDRGIPCERLAVSENAERLSEPFRHRLRTQRPWVVVKWAQTIDGRIATRTGESQWISGPRARRRVHRLRGRVDVILTGLGTAIADDPMLTARGVPIRRMATRVLIDTDLEAPPDLRLFSTARDVPTCVACSNDLATTGRASRDRIRLESAGVRLLGVPERHQADGGGLRLDVLLQSLHTQFGASSVMVEAGPGLLGALFDADLVDEAMVHIAPMLFGDERALGAASGRVAPRLADGRRYGLVRTARVGPDVELVYRRSVPSHLSSNG